MICLFLVVSYIINNKWYAKCIINQTKFSIKIQGNRTKFISLHRNKKLLLLNLVRLPYEPIKSSFQV
ncbi:hypothetical protein PRABACTJOHN_02725 [Parabacteroides johnsonii DSM 18315]|uniref:Uncharacterized protein n=1 Tax=Parabacteroides johnsonii DSM 18315 TaxID=537006 RepID=B7BCF6_9BACT|nr:hypothetical protein PRABACTJOHN_02725 [Parabacteroides johnsonii DSM 18315]